MWRAVVNRSRCPATAPQPAWQVHYRTTLQARQMTENGGASPTDPRPARFAFVSPLRYNHAMSQTAPPPATIATGAPAQSRLWDVLRRPASPEQRNQRNVLIDAIGVGITAGVGSFLSVFLVRLGATDFQVGLLTAMPALTGMLLAMPVGRVPVPPAPHRALVRPLPLPRAHLLRAHRPGAVSSSRTARPRRSS